VHCLVGFAALPCGLHPWNYGIGCSVLVLCVVAYLIGCGAKMGALRGLDVATGGGLCVREAGSCWSGGDTTEWRVELNRP
jgi:hypothetical protein